MNKNSQEFKSFQVLCIATHSYAHTLFEFDLIMRIRNDCCGKEKFRERKSFPSEQKPQFYRSLMSVMRAFNVIQPVRFHCKMNKYGFEDKSEKFPLFTKLSSTPQSQYWAMRNMEIVSERILLANILYLNRETPGFIPFSVSS